VPFTRKERPKQSRGLWVIGAVANLRTVFITGAQ
jgi:hypothetical protein